MQGHRSICVNAHSIKSLNNNNNKEYSVCCKYQTKTSKLFRHLATEQTTIWTTLMPTLNCTITIATSAHVPGVVCFAFVYHINTKLDTLCNDSQAGPPRREDCLAT